MRCMLNCCGSGRRCKAGEDMKTAPIAVFDSGVGGISVLKELVALLPGENYLYFGDSANAPYGEKTTEEVRALTLQAAEMLFDRGAKALVVACNTATSAAIHILREKYPEKIIIGKSDKIRLVIMAVLAGGHVLLDDLPGVGKTTLVKTLSIALGCQAGRIQFVPDMLPSDIIGMRIFNQKTGDFELRHGPRKCIRTSEHDN